MLEKPPLRDPSVVADLVLRWQRDHDERARDDLVRRFMPIIRSAARKWGTRYLIHPDDADQEASLGFLRAIDLYDPDLGTLETYTFIWARSQIAKARLTTLALKVSHSALADASVVGRAAMALRDRLGRRATVEEIATAAGFGVMRTELALRTRAMPNMTVSTSAPLSDQEDGTTLGDILPADEEARPDAVAEVGSTASAARDALEAVVATFVSRHQTVYRICFLEGRPLDDAGAVLGVGRQRVQQIHAKILQRLREALVDHPAVAEILGRGHVPALQEDSESGELLGVAEVEMRTGIEREALAEMIGRGTFPRWAAKDGRGRRLWREVAVERWLTSSASPSRLQSFA